jgi:hypothetical protein
MEATEIKDRSETALRYALQRVKAAEEKACRSYRQRQEVLRENGAARAKLAAMEHANESLRAKLTSIENSSEYKSLQVLDSLVMPCGSLRRRFCGASFRGVRQLCRDLRLCVQLLHSFSSAAPLRYHSTNTRESSSLTTHGNLPLSARLSQGASPRRSSSTVPEDLAYNPACWQSPEENPEVDSLDLLILSPVHRTGSTLLQRICNARKQTLIWGEHGGVLKHFSSIFVNAALFSMMGESERRDYFGQNENPNVWIASMCPEVERLQQAVVHSARALLNTLYGAYRENHDLLGFKEVQYGSAELELLRKCYPAAQFLLLLRNPLYAWRSTPTSWYGSLDDWIETYNAGALGYCEFAKRDPNSHLIRYVDLIEQESKTMEVLGDVARVSREQISMVLAHKIGATRAPLADSDRAVILRECRETMEILGFGDRTRKQSTCRQHDSAGLVGS